MNKKQLTLGSLFDGSGGFPLGGIISGITPVWASEIEPFAVRVTTKRMPFIKHYGDISEMDGSKIEPVDIITFGSPCQDMSVAGKRSGLDGSRSSLFYEAVRIITEMRSETNGKYPRYIVWENVPGAFSSNNGQDFKAVLDSLIGIVETDAEVPMPQKGEWPYADCYMGDGWSLAYRVYDAQYWGVPQRRRRIYLVADFASRSAGDILFKSEGLSGNTQESFGAWKGFADDIESGTIKTGFGFDGYNGAVDDKAATLGVNCGIASSQATYPSFPAKAEKLTHSAARPFPNKLYNLSGTPYCRNGVVLNDQGGNRMDVTEEVTSTLRAEAHHPPCVLEAAGFCTEHSAKSRSIGYEEETSPTLRAGVVPAAVAVENHPTDGRVKIQKDDKVQTLTSRMGTGGMNVPLVLKIRSGCEGGGKGALIQEDKSATLSCNNDQTLFEPSSWDGTQVSPTLTKQNAGGNQRMPDKDNFNCILEPFGISAKDSNAMKSSNPKSGIYKAKTSRTVDTSGGNPACNQGGIAVVCVDQGGGKSGCNVSVEQSPTLTCTHGGEPAICIQGSMIGRKDENGPQGNGINEDKSFTLNATDRHAVYAMTTGSFQQVEEDKSPTLMARDYKDPNAVCYGIGRDTFNQGKNAKFAPSFKEECQPTLVAKGPGAILNSAETQYTVRRLTPTECARLQGFPDWWCSSLGTEKPTDDEVYFWYKVFETHRKITGVGKPKTDKQIRSWLANPHSDSAEYKLWGNGVALPCVLFVLAGIVWANENNL